MKASQWERIRALLRLEGESQPDMASMTRQKRIGPDFVELSGLSTLPESIIPLLDVKHLTLSFNRFIELPNKLADLSQLLSLRIENNYSLVSLPDNLTSLDNLEYLSVSTSRVENLPDLIFPKLKTLNVGVNRIKTLPTLSLPSLSNLVLRDNYLLYSSLADMPNLPTLKKVDLYHCGLNYIPPFLFSVDNLQELNLSENPLQSLNLHQLFIANPKLKTLNLNGTLLETLSSSISHLTEIISLTAVNNKLSSIPPELYSLSQLQYLYLSYNDLTLLDEAIANLQNLIYLDLSSNQLTHLPQVLLQLKSLEHFVIYNNPLALTRQLDELRQQMNWLKVEW